ncbi:MAG: hypothetical protein ACRD0Y_01925 [Terriglobales bacterium]
MFRHAPEVTTVGRLWQACREAVRSGSPFELLLAAARLECACADGGAETGGRLIELSLLAARYFLGQQPRPSAAELWGLEAHLPLATAAVQLSAFEGIRFYALSPAGYAEAARRWRREQAQANAAAWVIGLRSMGSVLAPVVAAALETRDCRTRCLTLRPSGAPDQRQLQVESSLQVAMQRWRGEFLIVDEGPGLSGSSFAGTVAALRGIGIAPQRIALLPSWTPEPSRLSNAYAAQNWASWRVYAAAGLAVPGEDAQDASGGKWRQILGTHECEPVWPQHERRKFLCGRGRVLLKFGGFGRYGHATRERAAELARRGWGPALAPQSGDAGEGWISYRRIPAAPLVRPGAAWCEFAGRYLAFVAQAYRRQDSVPPSPELQEMVSANLEQAQEPPEGPVAALDGRMLPCEWGETARGYVKFDGTDHGDDPFFPGPADIAWDLAAVAVEFGKARGRAVLDAYCRASGETHRALAPRLVWHGRAYTAFRAGYCELAAAQTTSPDRERFTQQALRYRRHAATWDR